VFGLPATESKVITSGCLRRFLVALSCGCLFALGQQPSGVVVPDCTKSPTAVSLAAAVRIYQGSLTPRLDPYVGNPQAVSLLTSMLEDESERLFWEPVVLGLGYVAPYDPSLANRLVNYIESPRPFRVCDSTAPEVFRKLDARKAAIGMDEYGPKVRALVALGFLVAKADFETSAAHRQYLSDATGSTYLNVYVRWTQKEKYLNLTDRGELLVKFAKLGYQQILKPFGVQTKPPIVTTGRIECGRSVALTR
jgi:hypothetical protein